MPSSSSLLGSLFGSKRGKPPPQAHLPPAPPPPHPAAGHPQGPVEGPLAGPAHGHHAQYCHLQQNPPPYHHHHHHHPPQHFQHAHQCHHGPHGGHPAYGAHAHGHPPLPAGHAGHAAHHHGQPPAPPPPPAARPSPAASAQLCRQPEWGSRTPPEHVHTTQARPGVAAPDQTQGTFCLHLPSAPRPGRTPPSPGARVTGNTAPGLSWQGRPSAREVGLGLHQSGNGAAGRVDVEPSPSPHPHPAPSSLLPHCTWG